MPPKSAKRIHTFDYDPKLDLRPGRHVCDCQARKHALIRNCLSCGRVVCAQEGSGPCFTCGALVCTKDEQEILDRGSKKSQQLRTELMAKGGIIPTLKAAAEGLNQALTYRDKLLLADADSERRTRVNDLESDYLNMESSSYLTPEEREAILQRKAELRQMRMTQKQRIVVDFDFAAGKIVEQKEQPIETANDPVLQAILQQSQSRMRVEKEKFNHRLPNQEKLSADDFEPKYDKSVSSAKPVSKSRTIPMVDGLFGGDDDAFYAEIEQKGYCLALDQPLASFVINGLRKHVPCWDDVKFSGSILISATTKMMEPQLTKLEEEKARKRFGDAAISFPTIYQTGAIMGRVFVEDCLTWKEYDERFPENNAEFRPKDGFVLLLSRAEALETPIPHIPPAEFYQVNANLRKTVKSMLDPYFLG